MDGFGIFELSDEIFARIYGKSYKENCTVPRENLRYLKLLHKDLGGQILGGEMICAAEIAGELIEIFQELYAAAYPIEKIRLIDEYDADDELSMRDNNSSCFNFRFVSHTTRISRHGYGMAVDINPRYNPYIKFVNGVKSIEPANGVDFEDRTKDFPYKIVEGDLCHRLFAERGFLWGGNCWDDALDYQHFFKGESR